MRVIQEGTVIADVYHNSFFYYGDCISHAVSVSRDASSMLRDEITVKTFENYTLTLKEKDEI